MISNAGVCRCGFVWYLSLFGLPDEGVVSGLDLLVHLVRQVRHDLHLQNYGGSQLHVEPLRHRT